MADSRIALLKVLARIRPEIWEIIGGGPQGEVSGPVPDPWHWGARPVPQPWRPSTTDTWRRQSQLAAVQLTQRLVDAASLIQAQGGDGPGFLRAVSDDWGVEGRPMVVRLPRDWWKLIPPPPPPHPNELDLLAVLAAAGLSFTTLSEQIDHPQLREAAAEAGMRVLTLATDHTARLEAT